MVTSAFLFLEKTLNIPSAIKLSELIHKNIKINNELDLPIISGTEDEKAIDIRRLRSETGYISYDPSYGNTGSCSSSITFIDGEKGILRNRGIPIEHSRG